MNTYPMKQSVCKYLSITMVWNCTSKDFKTIGKVSGSYMFIEPWYKIRYVVGDIL